MTGTASSSAGCACAATTGCCPTRPSSARCSWSTWSWPSTWPRPGGADDLDRTVDYGSLAGRVAEVVGGRPRKLLEAVAEDVAQLVLADERVRQVRVRVTKPQAPLPVDAARRR